MRPCLRRRRDSADPSLIRSATVSLTRSEATADQCSGLSTYFGGMAWRVTGSYFEACNCDAICPCRRIDGVPGGRSTHGECLGVLSWLIESGNVDEVRLDGLAVALAVRYSDDEEGSPWTHVVYLDARADEL